MNWVRNLFDTSDFPPRWHCGSWTAPLGYLHIVSDLLIFAAYFAIPTALAIVAFRRRDFPFSALLLLFVTFILACGTTHLIEAIIFYHPIYRLAGLAKAFTAVVSVLTALVLIRSLPSLLALPGLQRVINDLRAALSREELVRAELASVRDALERRSAEMTQRLRRTAASLAAAKAVALRWSDRDGRIDWEIGFVESWQQAGLAFAGVPSTVNELFDALDAARFRRAVDDALRSGDPVDFQGALAADPKRSVRLSASVEPPVEGQPRYLTGVFRIL